MQEKVGSIRLRLCTPTAISVIVNSLDDYVSNLPFSPDFFLGRVDFRVDLRSSVICYVKLG